MRRGISLDETGIALDVQIGWATALPVLALLALAVASLAAYRRSVRGHGWLAAATATVNEWLAAREMRPVSPGLVGLGTAVAAIWLALLLIALVGMVWVPVTLAFGDPLSEDNAGTLRWYLLTFTALTAALGALVALPFTVLRTILNARQTETARQSHITDQINKAVEALGATRPVKYSERRITFDQNGEKQTVYSANLSNWRADLPEGAENIDAGEIRVGETQMPNREVRIGGIYALERIAQDSLRDHVQIMEILTAYIRENAPAKGLAPLVPALDPLPDDATPEARAAHVEKVQERAKRLREADRALEVDTVIQAAIHVIARREEKAKKKEREDFRYQPGGYWIDLQNANLRRINIGGLDLARAALNGARMEGAELPEVRLIGADLNGAHLEGANLRGAFLNDVKLLGVHLEGAQLDSARLDGAGFGMVRLDGASLKAAELRRCDFVRANLTRADFTGALLAGTRVKWTDLSGTNLTQAQVGTMFADGTVRQEHLPPGVQRPRQWPEAALPTEAFREEWETWQDDPKGYTPP